MTNLPTADAFALATFRDYFQQSDALIEARRGLFSAVRTYLQPEQRRDGVRLGDRLAHAPARVISDECWVSCPARGYLAVIEDAEAGRSFRLCVLQQGRLLRVGVRLPAWQADHHALLSTVFSDKAPLLSERVDGSFMVDWTFYLPDIYRDVQVMEEAIYRIGAVFEAALQAYVPRNKEHFQ